jgi:CRP/FNR family cyclic AMP-dependent transcriptional regulator
MAEIESTVKVLEQTQLFRGLKRRQLEGLAQRFVEREYAAGQAVVTQGQGGEGFFIVVSGAADAIYKRADETAVTLNSFGPGDFFGELAVLTDTLRTASVVATKATRCIVLTRWDLMGLLRSDADMAVAVLQQLAARFSLALARM